MKPFWTLARRMLRYRWALVGTVGATLLSGGSLGIGLIGAKPVLDSVLGRRHDLQDLALAFNERAAAVGVAIPQALVEALPRGPFTAVVWLLVALGLLTVFGGAANFAQTYLSLTVVTRAVTNIRREAFHRVLRAPLKDVVAAGPSDAISRIINDTGSLAAGFTAMLSKALLQAAKGAGSLIAAFVVDWRVALSAVLAAPLIVTVIRRLGKRVRRHSRAALVSQAGMTGAAVEALQGLRVVKVHTTERLEAGRFHQLNKRVMREMMRVRTARALASPLVEVLAIFFLGVAALFAIKPILDRNLDSGGFILCIICLASAGAALKPLTGIVNDVQASSGAADRVIELLRAAPEPGHGRGRPKLAPHRESIEFRDVAFTYPGAREPALRDVTLRIRHGERVAFVGANGSGKTTLLSLVPRLFDPDAGAVLIDGHDVRSVSVRSLRRQIGVVTQEVVLFRGTVRANIAYGASGVTDERVLDAALRARADEFIRALPGGYDAPVGEQGLTLSGGQRQRLAIARAILRDPSILILDEATSMIDADSEAKIGAALAEFSRGRTSLIVAHRLSTVLNADRIVVLDQGRVAAVGAHSDLLTTCPAYRLIAQNQLIAG